MNIALFWSKVKVPPTGCWPWKGRKNAQGYGVFATSKYGKVLAHRAAWAEKKGPIPAGQFVLHRCDNPACCNPEHLFIGTQRDNMLDMRAKGRHRNQFSGQPLATNTCGHRNRRHQGRGQCTGCYMKAYHQGRRECK